jgi:hypothetical protein
MPELEYYIPKTETTSTTDRRIDPSFKTMLRETELDWLCGRIRKERSVAQEIRTYTTMSLATKIDIDPTKAYIIDTIEAKVAPQTACSPGIYPPTPRLLKAKKFPLQKATIILHNPHQRKLAPRESPSSMF